MNGEKEIGTVYLCIHKKLKEYSRGCEMDKKRVTEILCKNFHIPKPFICVVLKELENYNLIVNNKRDVKVINIDTAIETPSVLYLRAGLF